MLERVITAEANEHPQSEACVPWWSFSKTVLAAAALVLVSRRRIDLDGPIAGAPYTLRQLLQHTSGLPDYGPIPEYHAAVAAREQPWCVDELLRRANASTLLFKPGERFAYSNIGYLFVRQLIERVADANLNTALRALVFDPLGIEGAFVASTVEEFDRIVWRNARGYDPRWVYHGCVIGSLWWAAVFLHRLMHGELLGPEPKRAMLEPRPYDAHGDPPPGYGLGVMREDSARGRLAGHAGSGPGSTVVVFSFLDLATPRTLAAAVDVDDPDTFPKLIEHLGTLV